MPGGSQRKNDAGGNVKPSPTRRRRCSDMPLPPITNDSAMHTYTL